jgi:hypothetical protein
MQQALARVRQAAQRNKGMRFTALPHHVYNPDMLREAYFALKRDASAGVAGETWRSYGEGLEDHLQDLSARLKRGAYRARPGHRAYIRKEDGRMRPLEVIAVEDKAVQRATTTEMNAICETDFLGFTHICGEKYGNGMFTVKRQTIRQRPTAKLSSVKAGRPHESVPRVGR